MPLHIITVPCLSDNYAYLLRDTETGTVALVDAPEDGPILAALQVQGWPLDLILITHHHYDHIDGVETLRAATGAKVVGAKADVHRLPPLDLALSEGDTLAVGNSIGHVFDVSGHTLGHIAYHFPDSAAVFTADSLMALGCGRLFEGSPAQMWDSLQKFAALPGDTLVYSGHEYTASNARFAQSIDPDNAALAARTVDIARARAKGEPTVPSRLSLERATNPFLRPFDPAIRDFLGMQNATDADVFREIRSRKDRF